MGVKTFMTDCPCCSYQLLRHIRHHQIIWFCRHCWQEMPDLMTLNAYPLLKQQSLEHVIQQPIVQPLALAS
jgi:ribosomal protein L37AE/L43A